MTSAGPAATGAPRPRPLSVIPGALRSVAVEIGPTVPRTQGLPGRKIIA